MALSDLIAPRIRATLYEMDGDGVDLDIYVEFDASLDETHSGTNDVTDYPVEEGTSATDNSRPQPDRLDIHGMITNIVNTTLLIGAPGINKHRGRAAEKQLTLWRKEGTRVAVVTSLKTYLGMVIESAAVMRNASNADGAEFNLALREVRTVKAKTTASPPRVVKPPRVDKSTKAIKATDAATNAAVLYQLFGDG